MTSLIVALQDGFADDLIVVRVNGREVFNKKDVKTKLMLGYADSIEVQVKEGSAKVEIILPLRKLSETIILHVSKTVYLGASILEGKIDYRISHEPFGYL